MKPAAQWTCRIGGVLLLLCSVPGLALICVHDWTVKEVTKLLPHAAGFLPPANVTGLVGEIFGTFILLMIGIRLLQVATGKDDQAGEISSLPGQAVQVRTAGHVVPARPMARTPIRRWRSCNVLQVGASSRQLWGFGVGKHGFALSREQAVPESDPLPPKLVAKDWKTLFQPKLNIALLPINKVFLRVLHLPVGAFDETLAMVELQLEKVSPLPVTQIVWSIQTLPQNLDDLQTVIAIIVSRELVDEVLGGLEKQGYIADRLEVPLLDQLQATPITADGAWIYPSHETGKFTALVAWWYGGVLRSLGLIHVPAAQNRGEMLEEQLKQMSWAGELEGWLTGEPRWHLIADEATARVWQPMFYSWLGQSVDVESPVAPAELAALTANRAARALDRANILPVDYATRYRQEFTDRLWMRGLGTVLAGYAVGVAIYLLLVFVQSYRTGNVEAEVKGLGRSYTNALGFKAQMQILQERQELKFAFLDCWKTTAELLPESLTLTSFEFKGGRTLTLNGTAPADSKLVSDFNNEMRKAIVTMDNQQQGQLLFTTVEIANRRLNPDRTTESWSFSCELARGEKE
jgi:hypothetical protein